MLFRSVAIFVANTNPDRYIIDIIGGLIRGLGGQLSDEKNGGRKSCDILSLYMTLITEWCKM
jgi:nitrate/nitrite transporter NarK